MNDFAKKYIIEKMSDSRNNRRDYEDERGRDDERRRDMEDERDYYDRLDERRGVKGTGRRRMRDRADSEDMYDERDYHHGKMKLSKKEMLNWKRNMENTDGTRGEHYDMQQVMDAAEKLGIKFHDFTEKQFCLVTNMMYSDYGHVIKHSFSGDKVLLFCAELAQAYFDDPDGVEPDEKLAGHYWCMTELA